MVINTGAQPSASSPWAMIFLAVLLMRGSDYPSQTHGTQRNMPHETTPTSMVVTVTRLNLTALDDSVLREWFADLAAKMHRALVNLQQKQAFHVNACIAQAEIDAAPSSIQGLYTDWVSWSRNGIHRKGTVNRERYASVAKYFRAFVTRRIPIDWRPVHEMDVV
ncbi:hypothetical protein BDR06DRAFT_1002431 [Suillus hirtellus]|nr:hypothetical protein BDR06DRAFT_1002431 [Suillus hirtellus]